MRVCIKSRDFRNSQADYLMRVISSTLATTICITQLWGVLGLDLVQDFPGFDSDYSKILAQEILREVLVKSQKSFSNSY